MILDGHHRHRVALSLDLPEVPVEDPTGPDTPLPGDPEREADRGNAPKDAPNDAARAVTIVAAVMTTRMRALRLIVVT